MSPQNRPNHPLRQNRKVLAFAAVLLAFAALTGALKATIVYNFETDLEGWTSVYASTSPVMTFDRQAASSLLRLDSFGISVPDGNSPHRDDVQNSGLLMRSPAFTFDNTSAASITFDQGGGSEVATNAPTTDTAPALTSTSSTGGYAGVLLRNATTGAYVMASAGSTAFNRPVETVSWSSLDLAGNINTSDTYTLDLVDLSDGPWGWISLDDVTIVAATAVPEPNAAAAIAGSLACLCVVLWRNKPS